MKLYHYTDAAGKKGIQQTGSVRPSSTSGPGNDDATFGPGVYLTSKEPTAHNTAKIAKNNYDGNTNYWKSQEKAGKTQHAMEFKVPATDVVKCRASDGRDVFRYDGGPLKVKDHGTGTSYKADATGKYKKKN